MSKQQQDTTHSKETSLAVKYPAPPEIEGLDPWQYKADGPLSFEVRPPTTDSQARRLHVIRELLEPFGVQFWLARLNWKDAEGDDEHNPIVVMEGEDKTPMLFVSYLYTKSLSSGVNYRFSGKWDGWSRYDCRFAIEAVPVLALGLSRVRHAWPKKAKNRTMAYHMIYEALVEQAKLHI